MALINKNIYHRLSFKVSRVAHSRKMPIVVINSFVKTVMDVLNLIIEVKSQESIRDCQSVNVLKSTLIENGEELRNVTFRSHINWI